MLRHHPSLEAHASLVPCLLCRQVLELLGSAVTGKDQLNGLGTALSSFITGSLESKAVCIALGDVLPRCLKVLQAAAAAQCKRGASTPRLPLALGSACTAYQAKIGTFREWRPLVR